MVKKRIYKPKNDNEFLEDVAMIIFVAGFNYKVVEQRWPLIKKAFKNFSVENLSRLSENDIEKLMKAKGMIKNRMKIKAVIENARECKKIAEEHDSVLEWIEKLKTDYKKSPLFSQSLEESFRRFDRIGKVTSGWLASLHNAKKNYIEYEAP